MRVVVTGSRHYDDWKKLKRTLDKIHDEFGIESVGTGGAKGADHLAMRWAKLKRITDRWEFEASWCVYGKAAGPLRNKRMIEEFKPDLVIAFGKGRGTDSCLTEARKHGIVILEVDRDEQDPQPDGADEAQETGAERPEGEGADAGIPRREGQERSLSALVRRRRTR